MNFSEKGLDSLLKEEWISKLEENTYIQKMSMNNMIMNYLVTGNEFWNLL